MNPFLMASTDPVKAQDWLRRMMLAECAPKPAEIPSDGEAKILAALSDGECTVGDLARDTRMTGNAVGAMLTQLLRRGLIQRERVDGLNLWRLA